MLFSKIHCSCTPAYKIPDALYSTVLCKKKVPMPSRTLRELWRTSDDIVRVQKRFANVRDQHLLANRRESSHVSQYMICTYRRVLVRTEGQYRGQNSIKDRRLSENTCTSAVFQHKVVRDRHALTVKTSDSKLYIRRHQSPCLHPAAY